MKGGGLSEPLAKIYMAQLINSLEYLQSKEVMHRDLKPLNVMIDDNYNIKLIDFGEAKYMNQDNDPDVEEKVMDTFVGTPNYLTPEVIHKDKHSPAIDIWAIACICFKMLVGSVPFPGTNHHQVYGDIMKREIKWPSKNNIRDYMSEEAQDLLNKMIQIDPNMRLGNNPESLKNELKKHPFFDGIDFDQVSHKDYRGAQDMAIRLANGDKMDGEGKFIDVNHDEF